VERHAKENEMPNFISNALVVTKGYPEVVWDALKGKDILERDTLFSLRRLIPYHEKPGQHWSEAAVEAWGTEWVDEVQIHPDHPNRLIFTSPWSPPYKVIAKLFSMFPEHEFEFRCFDIQNGKTFDWTGVKGEMIGPQVTLSAYVSAKDDEEAKVVEELTRHYGGAICPINHDPLFSDIDTNYEVLRNRVRQFVNELKARNIRVH
jgi:hypothetical protein